MTGYSKLHSTILGSTIWLEDPATTKVFLTMIALADRDGTVQASLPGLAHFANVTIEQAQRSVEKFLAPDQYSRTPDHEGRRIAVVDGGWSILNYEKYRFRMSAEDIRERDRVRKQRQRERQRDGSTNCGTERDTRDNSANSNKSSKAESRKQKAGKQFSKKNARARKAAENYCLAFDVVGEKNIGLIQQAIEQGLKKYQKDTPETLAELAIKRRKEFLQIGVVNVEWEPVTFITRGIWLEPNTWANKPKDSDVGMPL